MSKNDRHRWDTIEPEGVDELMGIIHGVAECVDSAPFCQQGEQAGRLDTQFTVHGEARVAVPLGQPFAIGSDHEGDVGIAGNIARSAQSAIEENLPRGGIEEIVASDDLIDSSGDIVDDNGQLIRGCSIGLGDDKIANLTGNIKCLGA